MGKNVKIKKDSLLSNKESNEWRELFKSDMNRALKVLVSEGYVLEAEVLGQGKQVNRGKIVDIWIQHISGVNNPCFDKISQYDFIKDGRRIQFKYVGQNSSPSISEVVRQIEESDTKFINRILKHYKEVDTFVISLENFITDITWGNCYKLNPKEFRKLILLQARKVKPGNKMRLRKILTRNFLADLNR